MTEKDLEIQELRQQRDLLLQENAELRDKHRWIPVEERLPDYNDVIVCTRYRTPMLESFVGTHCELSVHKNYGTAVTLFFDEKEIDKPGRRLFTHWMPLPEPPEKGK